MKGSIPETCIDPDLECDIDRILNQKNVPVMKIEHQGRTLWLKQPKKTGSRRIHGLSYFVTRLKGLMPVEKKSSAQALRYEVAKLQRLKEKGIPVPDLIGYTDRYFIMADTGCDLRTCLRKKELSQAAAETVFENCVCLLSLIHSKNEFHGGSQIKNYTIKDDRVYAIDFEDSFSEKYRLNDIQFRDLILLLISLPSLGYEVDYRSLIDIYRTRSKNCHVDADARRIAGKLNVIVNILDMDMVYSRVSRDVKNTLRLLKALQRL